MAMMMKIIIKCYNGCENEKKPNHNNVDINDMTDDDDVNTYIMKIIMMVMLMT